MFSVETSRTLDSSLNSAEAPSVTSGDAANTESAGYQLVPYKPSPVLPVFQEEKRLFEFAGKEWMVHQQWNDVGLASVVWEAVSIVFLLLYVIIISPQILFML